MNAHSEEATDLTLLEQLVARESSIQDICVHGKSFDVELDWPNGRLILTATKPAVRAVGALSRPIVHQIARRALPDLRSEVDRRVKRLDRERSWFEGKLTPERVRAALDRSNVVARVMPSDGEPTLYGIVSDQFPSTNQLDVREQFIEEARRVLGCVPRSRGISTDWTGAPCESFRLEQGGDFFDLGVGIRYGLNNGYSAYRIVRLTKVIVCANELAAAGRGDAEWIHNSEQPVELFIRKGVAAVASAHEVLGHQRERALATPLDRDRLRDLVVRMPVAWQSSLRILDRLRVEHAAAGKTDWALSQAMTWLGSHERALAQPRAFTVLGTDVLSDGLAGTLARYDNRANEEGQGRRLLLSPREAREKAAGFPGGLRADLESRLDRVAA